MNKYCYPSNPVRLACLIHAASVRSEPESNSQKKEFESSSHKHLLLFRFSSEGSFSRTSEESRLKHSLLKDRCSTRVGRTSA